MSTRNEIQSYVLYDYATQKNLKGEKNSMNENKHDIQKIIVDISIQKRIFGSDFSGTKFEI